MEKYLRSVVHCYLDHTTFNESNVGLNLLRILVIGTVYTLFECVGLLLSTLGMFHSDIRGYVFVVVLFHIVYLPFLVISYRHKWFKSNISYELLSNVYYIAVMLWASVFTTLVYLGNEDITIYSIVLIVISAIFIIEPNRSSVIYIANFVLFAGLVYSNVESVNAANAIVFKSLIVCVLALVVSQGNYISRKKLFDSNKELEEANEALKEKSVKDSLTHLYNNRYMFELLEKEASHARQYGSHLSLVMIDIDNFKRVNDVYGHLYGDEVIKKVSATIKSSTRECDVVGRYGGEEFIVILSDADKHTAISIAERIRQSVEALVFDKGVSITVSIGVSELSDENPKYLVGAADINLYKAKRSGKNRVVA